MEKQIMQQLSEAWNLADELYRTTEAPGEKAKLKERMDRISQLMEQTMRRTFDENDREFKLAVAAFKKNQKEIEKFKAGLKRSTQAVRFLSGIVARVDSLLQNPGG